MIAQLQQQPIHAILLRGFKPITARVLAASPHLKVAAKNGAGVDILSLHCLLIDQTRGLVGRAQLQSMKQGSLLVNTARGGIVDEVALVEALTDGAYKRLAGAGLDTFAHEPIEADHPLLKMSNVILTPHVAMLTSTARCERKTLESIATPCSVKA